MKRGKNFQHFGSILLIKLLQRKPEESKLTVKLTTGKRETWRIFLKNKIDYYNPKYIHTSRRLK